MKPYVVNNSGHRAHPCVYALVTGLPFFQKTQKKASKMLQTSVVLRRQANKLSRKELASEGSACS